MKRKLFTILIAITIVIAASCSPSWKDPPKQEDPPKQTSTKDPPKWKEYKTLGEIWPQIKREKVQSIVFCEKSDALADDIDNWYVRFEVPAEAIEDVLWHMEYTLGLEYTFLDIWEVKYMKIITDKNRYLMPVSWDSKKIYGSDWLSRGLRTYLRDAGFDDPR